MDEDSLLHTYLALRHGDWLSPAKFARQIQAHGNMESLLASPEHAGFAKCLARPGRLVQEKITAERRWAESPDRALLTFESPDYPASLRNIASPPPVLAVCGQQQWLKRPQLAMVGSRRCSAYGEDIARWLAFELAGCGLTITSGLARGIDTCAHHGALKAGGSTIAVVATGLDRVYPRANVALAQQCCEQGAVVSEFPLGTPPLPAYFPQRNRIISGLALGVLVVEASLQSGSLITARLALEQNREVFAVPGQINRAYAEGCHQLIKTGAKLVEQPGDVLTELGPAVLGQLRPVLAISAPTSHTSHKARRRASDERGAAVLRALAKGDLAFDSLQARCRLPTDTLNACLLQLEIQGLVCRRDGRIGITDRGCSDSGNQFAGA